MNIEQAKTQIKNATIAYFTKNNHGEYVIPIERQRPVFLVGAPGIGKTAIMEQIANELNVGLVTYSMTHHTRQSALGLPFISQKTYGGKTYSVSEYTMSEIIASIYEYMEQTGKKEGILFLDEINCVSETLAPAMLQFLQYKIFGNHAVPEGWIVVTAGNPPEFNRSVHEFDIVTWDRLKKIEVEPDFDIWKKYAKSRHMHSAVIAYLEAKPNNFYRIKSTINGRELITARGWEDVSQMLQIYEKNNLKADINLIQQYVHCAEVARDFAVYYDMYSNYKSKFSLDKVIAGSITDDMLDTAKDAALDERVAIVNLLTESLLTQAVDFMEAYKGAQYLTSKFRPAVTDLQSSPSQQYGEVLHKYKDIILSELDHARKSQAPLSEIHTYKYALAKYEECATKILADPNNKDTTVQAFFTAIGTDLGTSTQKIDDCMTNVYTYLESAFGVGDELVLLSTAITNDATLSKMVAQTNNKKYLQYVDALKISDRREELLQDISSIDVSHTSVFSG